MFGKINHWVDVKNDFLYRAPEARQLRGILSNAGDINLTYPRDFLRTFVPSGARSRCFVLMPFARSFDAVYGAVRDACQSPDLLLTCARADDIYHPGNIMEGVMEGIASADFVVADVTGKNPNVFYELGIAHSCKDASSVVIMTQSLGDVPFDLRHMRCIVYRNEPGDLRRLRGEIERALVSASKDVVRFSVTEGEPFHFKEPLTGHRRNYYRFTIGELHLGRGSAKFGISVHRESLSDGNATEGPSYHYLEEGDILEIPRTHWSLRLDRTSREEAFFSVLRSAGVPPTAADGPGRA